MYASATRRIIFVNRFFFPDESATSQILTDVCEHLACEGFNVLVVTSRLAYADPSVRFATEEVCKGVHVKRVWTSGFGRAHLLGRILDYTSFYLASFFCVLWYARKGDILISKTDPPLISIFAGAAGRLKGAHRINWLQDLFPEVATALGLKSPFSPVLRWLRNRSLTTAVMNIAIGQRMVERLKANRIRAEQISCIPNFADDTALAPNVDGIYELRNAWGFTEDDFIVGYSGNLGRAHDFKTMLDAAELLKHKPHIKFLFVGGGHLRRQVEAEADERDLTNLFFKPYQPREALAKSLGVPNLHWISLNPKLEGLVLPSKLYGVAAVGRPVIVIGDTHGDAATIATEHSFGFAFEIGDCSDVAHQIEKLSTDPIQTKDLGDAARKYTDNFSSSAIAAASWIKILRLVMKAESPGQGSRTD